MKHSIIAMAVNGLFADNEQTSTGGTAANASTETPVKPSKKALVVIPERVDSWLAQGKKEGERVKSAQEKADQLRKEIAVIYGAYFYNNDGEGMTDFLTGYATGFPNPNTAKVRKAEMKAVLDAFQMGDEERSIVMGYDKEAKAPIKETHSILDWLNMHEQIEPRPDFKGMEGLLKLSKELRGPTTNAASGGSKRKSVVTEKQQKEVLTERLPLMNTHQAVEVIGAATHRLSQQSNFEPIAFREIGMICNKIKVSSNDKASLELASQIFDLVEAHIALLSSKDAKATASPAPATAPAPAQAPAQPANQPVQETAKAA